MSFKLLILLCVFEGHITVDCYLQQLMLTGWARKVTYSWHLEDTGRGADYPNQIFDFLDMNLRIVRIDPSRQVDMDAPKEKLGELF